MLKNIILTLILLLLASCQKTKEAAYNTDALDCISTLFQNTKENDLQASIQVLNKYKSRFKFAGDLEEKLSDEKEIRKAENLAIAGQLTEAKTLLRKRIVERGYSDELNKSLQIVESAISLKKFNNEVEKLSITDASREFATLSIKADPHFDQLPSYVQWQRKQKRELASKANQDKELILNSLRHTADHLALSAPNLIETIILEHAAQENAILIPKIKETLDKKASTFIQKSGTPNDFKSYHQFMLRNKQASGTLTAQLQQTFNDARKGNTAAVLASLQELNDLTQIQANFRQQILKTLFLSKGWNSASLINRDFLDISFLLETVYKANQ